MLTRVGEVFRVRGVKRGPGLVLALEVYFVMQVHSDLTHLLEEVRRDQPMGLLLARAGVSREVVIIVI